MDSSLQIDSLSISSGVQSMTGGGHHHHHHKSISDQVSQMGSAIDKAVSAGTMTSDQASALKKELADITQTLSQNAAPSGTATGTSGTGATTSSNPLSQLSDADRKKVFGELQDVRKQIHAAFSSQNTSAASGATNNTDAVTNLFSKIDTNGDGSIDKNEFTQFLAQIGANALGYDLNGNANANSSALTGSTFSAMA
jgi:hypothetical protein